MAIQMTLAIAAVVVGTQVENVQRECRGYLSRVKLRQALLSEASVY